jgi:hypothetical protein
MFEDLIKAAKQLNLQISQIRGLVDAGEITLLAQEETLLEITQDQVVEVGRWAELWHEKAERP